MTYLDFYEESGPGYTGVHKIVRLHEIARRIRFLTRDGCHFFSMAMQGNEM
jgi:hypothetical protein